MLNIFFKNADGTFSAVSASEPLPVTGGGTTNGSLETTQQEIKTILANGFADTSTVTVAAGAPTSVTATIANAASLSGSTAVAGKLVGLLVPAAWTAAAITFQGSVDGTNFFDVYDDGTERTVASANVVANRFLSLDLNDWLPFTHIKVRSGTSAAAVNQGASRAVILSLAG